MVVIGVAPTPDGGVYAVGRTERGIAGVVDRGIFAARYCADGSRLWLDQFGATMPTGSAMPSTVLHFASSVESPAK